LLQRIGVWGLGYFRKSTADQWSITTTKPRMMRSLL
jgi:hypothetical protein